MHLETRHLDELDDAATAGFDLAVVIDVVRAFTVAPWVLRRGASALYLSPDATTALRARDDWLPGALLLKDGGPDPRFALPNSPGLVARADLTGRTVVQTTGNGTRGAHAVRGVPKVACASFVNAGATAELIARHRRVLLVPTEGDEDRALADYLTAAVRDGVPPLAEAYLDGCGGQPPGWSACNGQPIPNTRASMPTTCRGAWSSTPSTMPSRCSPITTCWRLCRL